MIDGDDYRTAWATFRRYAIWNLALMPTMLITTFLAAIFNRELSAVHMLIPAFVCVGALYVGFVVANYKLRQWRCPRCNRLWMTNTGLFAKCRVCGLVRGTSSTGIRSPS